MKYKALYVPCKSKVSPNSHEDVLDIEVLRATQGLQGGRELEEVMHLVRVSRHYSKEVVAVYICLPEKYYSVQLKLHPMLISVRETLCGSLGFPCVWIR